MRFRLKTLFTITAIVAVTVCVAARTYNQFVPRGLRSDSFTPYFAASNDGGSITSPNGVTYHIRFNDAGAMHSGNHWTWVISNNFLTGSRLVTEGYLGPEYAVQREQIPVEWEDDKPILPFRSGRYE